MRKIKCLPLVSAGVLLSVGLVACGLSDSSPQAQTPSTEDSNSSFEEQVVTKQKINK